jgi:hypothetical protein
MRSLVAPTPFLTGSGETIGMWVIIPSVREPSEPLTAPNADQGVTLLVIDSEERSG